MHGRLCASKLSSVLTAAGATRTKIYSLKWPRLHPQFLVPLAALLAAVAVQPAACRQLQQASVDADEVADTTQQAAGTVGSAASDAAGQVAAGASGAANTVADTATGATDTVADGASDAADTVADGASDVVDNIGNAFQSGSVSRPAALVSAGVAAVALLEALA